MKTPNDEANARLIATAPDLLTDFEEAAEALCGFTCRHSLGAKTRHSEECQGYSATLAKARGEAT